MKNICTLLLFVISAISAAQTNAPDTVIIELANTSRILFTMEDPQDIGQLREYDFQALFDDVLFQLEARDSGQVSIKTLATLDKQNRYNTRTNADEDVDVAEDEQNETNAWEDKEAYTRRKYIEEDADEYTPKRFPYTRQFFNAELGINYLHARGGIPYPNDELFAVRPWGSWHVALNSTQRTHLSRKFALEWSFGISWYNFKFYEEDLLITRQEDEVYFEQDPRPLDFTKSKLTVSYLNASFIPMYDARSRHSYKRDRCWQNSSFRIGAGPYAGLRLSSYTKQQYEADGDKEFDREHDHFYLQDLRYGIRLQVGIKEIDVYFNYDLNEFFEPGKGPDVNAFSFGVVF